MTSHLHTSTAASLRRHLMVGSALVAMVVGGAGGWAATAEISGAVVALGSIVVDSNIKRVQHPTGGVVAEVQVRDGDRVEAGDLLVRLDDTVTRSNLAIVTKQLDELAARKARLETERDGDEAISFPEALTARVGNPEVARLVSGERKLYESRSAARLGQQAQFRQRIEQLTEEIRGHATQITAKTQEAAFIARELAGIRELWQKNLLPISRLTTLEREATRIEGERGQLIAGIAQARGKIAETELQIIQIDRDLSSEVGKDIREIEAKVGELIERKVTAEDQLKRIEVRAPHAGIIHQSTVHTIGGVIAQGETMMLIVPNTDKLDAEIRIAPQDIDQLQLGQMARLRFTAFNRRTTPEISGKVNRVSADRTVDQLTGQHYFTARVTLSAEEVALLGEVKIVPGIPVEAFVMTSQRTVLSYLTKSLHDQVYRAFREK